jgi:hypothetical protein
MCVCEEEQEKTPAHEIERLRARVEELNQWKDGVAAALSIMFEPESGPHTGTKYLNHKERYEFGMNIDGDPYCSGADLVGGAWRGVIDPLRADLDSRKQRIKTYEERIEGLCARVEGLEREKHPEISVTADSGGIALYVNGERRPITPHALDGGRWITYKEIAVARKLTEDLRAHLQKLEQPEIERITCNVRDELMRELGIDSPVAPCRESTNEHPSDAGAGRDAPFETEGGDE